MARRTVSAVWAKHCGNVSAFKEWNELLAAVRSRE